MTSLKQYVLRYWETEFPELRPSKNRAGNRIYRLNDIKIIFQIKKLLYEEKFTIEGARQKLKLMHKDEPTQIDIPFREMSKEQMILDLKKDVMELLSLIESGDSGDSEDEAREEDLSEIDDHDIGEGFVFEVDETGE